MRKPSVKCSGYRDSDFQYLDISKHGDLLLKHNEEGVLRILDLSRKHLRNYREMHSIYLSRFLARKSMAVYIEEYNSPCLSIH